MSCPAATCIRSRLARIDGLTSTASTATASGVNPIAKSMTAGRSKGLSSCLARSQMVLYGASVSARSTAASVSGMGSYCVQPDGHRTEDQIESKRPWIEGPHHFRRRQNGLASLPSLPTFDRDTIAGHSSRASENYSRPLGPSFKVQLPKQQALRTSSFPVFPGRKRLDHVSGFLEYSFRQRIRRPCRTPRP